MSFVLPADVLDTPTKLRDLEQNCARTTPKDVREALVTAAKEIESWRNTAVDCIRMLEEANELRIGQMDSHSKAEETSRQVRRAMSDSAMKLRALL